MSKDQQTKVNLANFDESSLNEMRLDELNDILSLTIRHDRNNKLITFLCMLSAYTNSSQLNVCQATFLVNNLSGFMRLAA
jgi:hypothetical protein